MQKRFIVQESEKDVRLSLTAAKQGMYSSAVTGRVLVVLRLIGKILQQSRKQVPCIIRLS